MSDVDEVKKCTARFQDSGQFPSVSCPMAGEAADAAVKKVFAILGVDVDDPEKVEEFRMDLRFGRSMRRASDRGIMAFMGLVAAAIGAALWAGIVQKITGGH